MLQLHHISICKLDWSSFLVLKMECSGDDFGKCFFTREMNFASTSGFTLLLQGGLNQMTSLDLLMLSFSTMFTSHLRSILKEMGQGSFYVKTGLVLREASLKSRLLLNSEVWYCLTMKEIGKLEDIDKTFFGVSSMRTLKLQLNACIWRQGSCH